MRRCSTASAVSGRVVLLRLDGVVHINWGIHLMTLVFGLLPLAAAVIVLVCDCMFQAGALPLTVGLAWSCRLLRALIFVNI